MTIMNMFNLVNAVNSDISICLYVNIVMVEFIWFNFVWLNPMVKMYVVVWKNDEYTV